MNQIEGKYKNDRQGSVVKTRVESCTLQLLGEISRLQNMIKSRADKVYILHG